jgi:hypothetical protein
MYRVSFEKIFKNGQMLDRDLPVVLSEDIKTKYDLIKFLNGMFGSYSNSPENGGNHRGCLESTVDVIPSDTESKKISFLKGDRCRCRLIIERY